MRSLYVDLNGMTLKVHGAGSMAVEWSGCLEAVSMAEEPLGGLSGRRLGVSLWPGQNNSRR